jgi:hypothetical protein
MTARSEPLAPLRLPERPDRFLIFRIFLDTYLETGVFRFRPAFTRGALRDRHGRWERDAMDAGWAQTYAQPWRTAKSCGPGAPTLALNLWKRTAGDGGKRARSPRRSRISRKTIVQGMPAVAVYPWLLTPVLFCCTGGLGCNAHPAFPAPSVFERAERKSKPRTHFVPRDRGVAPPSVSCPASSGAPSTPQLLGSSTSISEYWIARSSRATTTERVAV